MRGIAYPADANNWFFPPACLRGRARITPSSGQLRAALLEGVIRPGSRRQARRKNQLFASARQAMPGVIVVNPADDAPVIVGMKFLEMTTVSAAPDNHRVLNQRRIRRDCPRFGAHLPQPGDAYRIANAAFHRRCPFDPPGKASITCRKPVIATVWPLAKEFIGTKQILTTCRNQDASRVRLIRCDARLEIDENASNEAITLVLSILFYERTLPRSRTCSTNQFALATFAPI